jgi:hypothetical protein
MLKKEITYEDFNGETVTEYFYFNLSKTELLELEHEYNRGFTANIEAIVEANSTKELVAEFKKIILLAYGKKSEDGKRFIKNDELREEFSQTAAFNELFISLATDETAASAFINGIVPKDMAQTIDETKKTKTTAELALEQSNPESA